jgi:SAM-dependent methyltransferase
MGYQVDEIDPNVNGVDLETFYCSPSAEMASYDLILCVSVLEHVRDDQPFVRMAADLLAPNGIAVFTVDFAESYVNGDKTPQADERFYTTNDIGGRLMSALPDCSLLDVPRWNQGAEDFEYEDCQYGFAGWVFRKFGEDILRRSYRDGSGAPAWKQLLRETTSELEVISNIREILCQDNVSYIARNSGNLDKLEVIHNRLVYDLKFGDGSSELQLALKLARLMRKISWWANPSRRRKWKKNKAAAQSAAPTPQEAPAVSALADYLDSALITLALHRKNQTSGRQTT